MRYDEIISEAMKNAEEAGVDKRWFNLGTETQAQNRLNREYIDSIAFEMRLLDHGDRGRMRADTRSTVFGVEVPAPIMPAAMMHGRVWDKLARGDLVRRSLSFSFTYDYLEEVAAGVAEAESINWVGVATGREDLLATEWLRMGMEQGNKTIVIVKPLRYKEKVLQLLRDSEKLGAVAVGMDIDSMFYEKVMDEYEGPKSHGPQSIEDLKEYKETTDLPFIVKGVLSVRDAKICKDEIGADGIVISTHGGECIDYLMPILKALPEIRKAVGKDMRIDVDTGFRRGSDVLKALALGADGVCFGQLMVLAFTAYGRLGITNMLRILYKELERTMTFTGCKNIAEIDSSILRFT